MTGRRAPRVAAALAALAVWAAAASAHAAEGGAVVRRVKVMPDKCPDCSSLKSIVETVTRGSNTNDEKAIALYNFNRLTQYQQHYPSEPGGVGAIKQINVYGWSLCGGLHTVQSALWREAGWKWRYVGWSNPGHTTTEVEYDGAWHYFDVFLKLYVWKEDPNLPGGRTVASQADIKADPSLVLGNLVYDKSKQVYYQKDNLFEVIGDKANWRAPTFLVTKDTAEGVAKGVRSNRRSGSPTGWAGIKFDSPGYSTDVNLSPGHVHEVTWDRVEKGWYWRGKKADPHHGPSDRDYRNSPAIGPVCEPYAKGPEGKPHTGRIRSWANGTVQFRPDFGSAAFLDGLAAKDNVRWRAGRLVAADAAKPASITVDLSGMPYVMVRASGEADRAEKCEVSTDGGRTFAAADLDNFSKAVNGSYRCLVRVSFKELRSLELEALVMLNRFALPYLSPGKNKVAVSVADPKILGANRLVVTYCYCPGVRTRSYEEMAERGAEVAKAHYASWPDPPTVVRKTFTASDLPATFEIDIPTPKGKYPVYPRMLFLRREVVAPGQRPSALPEGAAQPKAAGAGELQTLPNPFTIGTQRPPKRVLRPTVTKKLPLAISHAVSLEGEAAANHFIKWVPKQTWVVLVGGELKDLPGAREIAAARLVLPVVQAKDKARTKIAAVALKATFEAGKAYDFKNLGGTVGTAVLPKQTGGAYNPPKEFRIDVKRYVKSVAAGEAKFHGFAVRTVQDRAVDDGWWVRADFSKTAHTYVEIEVYADKQAEGE